MCDYRSRRNYPCEQGQVRCDKCRGTVKANVWRPDVGDYRRQTCPDCRGYGAVPCPNCNQGSSGGGGGPVTERGWGNLVVPAVIIIVVVAVGWWGWHAVRQAVNKAENPTPVTVSSITTEPRIPSDEHYTVIVNGAEVIGHGPSSSVSCDDAMYRAPRDATKVVVGFDNSFKPAPGVGGAGVTVTNTDPPEVVNVEMRSYPDKHWLWNRGQQPGDAAVTKNGNTYRVTGSIAPASGSADASPVPFEFEATCP
jgi:lipoprotein antigen